MSAGGSTPYRHGTRWQYRLMYVYSADFRKAAPANQKLQPAQPATSPPATVAGMADDDDWTPGDITGMIANPFYAITIDEGLPLPQEPMISEDDWIKANITLISELGPEPYLRNLLSVLKGT